MTKGEAEIRKIEIEIKEIEQRIKNDKVNNPILKFILTGIVAGVVFFASWLGIYKEILFRKNTVAIEDAKLAHLKNQQLEIENQAKIKVIHEQKLELEAQIKEFQSKNQKYIERINKLQKDLDKSSNKYKEYENELINAQKTNNGLESQLQILKFSGSIWELMDNGNKNKITLLANGRVDGFGKYNDYWDITNNEIILYTGADDGKESWTRKWIGKNIEDRNVSGIVIDPNGNRLKEWSMKEKED